MDKKVILKPGKEKPIKNKHHWIFSGAVLKLPEFTNGDILPVYSQSNEFLGLGYFNRNSNIIGRLISFEDLPITEILETAITKAILLRQNFFDKKITNAFRLINGEGDSLPGLIVDQYNDVLVMQIGTLGIDKLKDQVVEILKKNLKPKAIIEKSNLPTRKEEGLGNYESVLFGPNKKSVEIKENNYKFQINLGNSQKTGFFLDQREMRQLTGNLAPEKTVLNCFAYTGAFSVYAAKNKAQQVDTVEISEPALTLAKENFTLNKIKISKKYNFFQEDVFQFLRGNSRIYDFIILDPPAFAKRKKDIIEAWRGYKDINRLALKIIPSNGLLLTSSCSYHIDEEMFQKIIFQAAREANKNVKIIQKHRLAFDHPINIYHPEGQYLKSLLLYIS